MAAISGMSARTALALAKPRVVSLPVPAEMGKAKAAAAKPDEAIKPVVAAKPSKMTSLCDKCVALCCRYIALPIDNPTDRTDYDNIRWYLVHENIVVFIEDKQWYLGVLNKCKHLQPDNRCGIYETRPKICRKYTTANCDYHGAEYGYDKLFTSAEQLREYAEEKLGRSIIPKKKPKPRLKRRGNRLSLPVV